MHPVCQNCGVNLPGFTPFRIVQAIVPGPTEATFTEVSCGDYCSFGCLARHTWESIHGHQDVPQLESLDQPVDWRTVAVERERDYNLLKDRVRQLVDVLLT